MVKIRSAESEVKYSTGGIGGSGQSIADSLSENQLSALGMVSEEQTKEVQDTTAPVEQDPKDILDSEVTKIENQLVSGANDKTVVASEARIPDDVIAATDLDLGNEASAGLMPSHSKSTVIKVAEAVSKATQVPVEAVVSRQEITTQPAEPEAQTTQKDTSETSEVSSRAPRKHFADVHARGLHAHRQTSTPRAEERGSASGLGADFKSIANLREMSAELNQDEKPKEALELDADKAPTNHEVPVNADVVETSNTSETKENHKSPERDNASSEQARLNFEAKAIIQNNPHLRALLAVGDEMHDLYVNKVSSKEYEEVVKPKLEQKKLLYEMLSDQFLNNGYNRNALDYIARRTAKYTEASNDVDTGDVAMFEGNEVEIFNVIESKEHDGVEAKKAYLIRTADGKEHAVSAGEISFENTAEEIDQEDTEKKASPWNRLKNWKSELAFAKKIGGVQYFHDLMNGGSEWLRNRGVNELSMTPEEVEKQRQRNRVVNVIAGTAILLIATKLGGFIGGSGDGSEHANHIANGGIGGALGVTGMDSGIGDMGGPKVSDGLKDVLDGLDPSQRSGAGGGYHISADSADRQAIADAAAAQAASEEAQRVAAETALSNVSYDIPRGQGGLELFSNLNLSSDTWYKNAATLVERFPNDFRFVGNDVQISHSGLLSLEARQFIESLR